jgi:pimeloyl-ACP methyl ester carboxylesterase
MNLPGLLVLACAVCAAEAPRSASPSDAFLPDTIHRPPVERGSERKRERVVEHDSIVYVAPAERLSIHRVSAPPAGKAGTREPTHIVLLPGPVGSAFSMRHITATLGARGLPVLVIDPLGMGRSAHPAHADYSLMAQARRIEAVLDTLRVARALVVAQGTSATVALRLAAVSPERIVGVLSLAGGPIDRQETTGVRLALALASLLDNPLGRAIGRRRFLAAVREQSASPAWCTPDIAARYLAPVEADLRGTFRTLRAMQAAVEPTRIETVLRQVRAPVHLLVGDHRTSHAPTAAQVTLLQHHLSAFTVDTVSGAGTMLHEERADAIVEAVLAMLARDG